MRYQAKIDPRQSLKGKHTSVIVTGPTLVVEIDEQALALEVAEAHAKSVVQQMRMQPGGKWHKTGHLIAGLAVRPDGSDGAALTAPADRLQRPEPVDKLTEDVAALRDPESDRRVKAAIEETADGLVKVQR